jgi:hypothetical protein
MAAAASTIVGGKVAADQSAGLIKTVMDALNKNVLSLHWERDPKKSSKMRLGSVDVNVTTGLILGAAALALLWEIGNWFAQGFEGNAGSNSFLTDAELVSGPAGWITLGLTDLFGNPVKDSSGNQKTVSAPPTFGAAYNNMLRNFTLAGPGQAAQTLMNMVAKATTQS